MKNSAVCTAIVLCGCSITGSRDEDNATTVIARDAKDPQSVIVRNISKGPDLADGHVICGEWNAKNGFGGMGSWAGFMIQPGKQIALYVPSLGDADPDNVRGLAKSACPGVIFP